MTIGVQRINNRGLTIVLPEFFLLGRTRVPSIPSANVLIRWNRSFALGRFAKLKRLYSLYILAAQSSGRWGPPAARVLVEIERRGSRLLDVDNITAGAKYLLDALRLQGIVVDDSPENLDLVVRQEKASKEQRGVTVTVTELS